MEIIFEWNAKKARDNIRNHRISFDEAKKDFQ